VLVSSHVKQTINVLLKGKMLHTTLVGASDTEVSRGILEVICGLVDQSTAIQIAFFKDTLSNEGSGLVSLRV
jgi:sulfur transfer protein SufE